MKRWIPLILLANLLLSSGSTSACPMCKDSIPTSDAEVTEGLPAGFNHSIYYMFGGLFGALGIVGVNLYRGGKR